MDRVSTLTAALTSEQAVVDEKARAVQLVQDRLLAATAVFRNEPF